MIEEDRAIVEIKSTKKEISPLFDHLQSLLVEVDDDPRGSDDHEQVNNGKSDKDDGGDDDGQLFANLPPYSSAEFIYGPKRDHGREGAISVIIGTSDSDTDYDDIDDDNDDGNASAMFDVSSLTLDQRTYIQLRAARLIDTRYEPSHHASSSPSSSPVHLSTDDSSPRTTLKNWPTEVSDDEPIDEIVQKMKGRLSNLHVENNAQVIELRRLALSDVAKNTSHNS